VVTYRLSATGRSVTTNWVGGDYAVLNGPATFITVDESIRRPHEVLLELPEGWSRSMTGLDAVPDGHADHYRAPDFDTLADSPIVAGNPVVHEFAVDGTRHLLVDIGEVGDWDGTAAVEQLAPIVSEVAREWGGLPFERYLFLNVFRRGGGGLEHLNSTLLTAGPGMTDPTPRWLSFVAHEYVHAFNVKRLRPVELGPFDYEHPPDTGSLWISEGLTTYYADLAVMRSGVGSLDGFFAAMSSQIRRLQTSPGRLLQTLEQSSLEVWSNSTSGVGTDPDTTVSYYVKGPVVGLLLDARIRRLTQDTKSLDDVMRLALDRYGGERGFTPQEFEATAGEVAGADLSAFFARAVRSTEELDYAEMLDWYGLRFVTADAADPDASWRLEIRPDATTEQARHLDSLAERGGRP
jgi:predicted metalloprotease with PDZ domain